MRRRRQLFGGNRGKRDDVRDGDDHGIDHRVHDDRHHDGRHDIVDDGNLGKRRRGWRIVDDDGRQRRHRHRRRLDGIDLGNDGNR
jgi:hypothetical protein